MAREVEKEKVKSHGFTTDPDDAISGGIFGPGRAKFLKARYGKLVYADGTKAIALKVSASRSGEKADLGWTVGKGFTYEEGGLALKPMEKQGGISTSCNLFHFVKSLQEHGVPKDVYRNLGQNASLLDGLECELVAKPLERISRGKSNGKDGGDRERTVLVVDEIYAAPWKKGGKAKDEDEDEDSTDDEKDDEDEEEEEEEEKPKKKKKPAADEDDEKPAKKKAKVSDDDDEDDEEEEADEDEGADEDIDEAATEGLIEALTDGPLRLSKVKDAVLAVPAVKKHKQGKVIAARAAEEKFLKKETGWTFNGKVVDLDK